MRIIFLAVDDEFAGEMQRQVYAQHPEWIVGSVLATQPIYKHTPPQAIAMVLKKSGPRYLVEMAKMKILRRLMGDSTRDGSLPVSPSELAEEHGVPTHHSGNINDEESLTWLRNLEPDLVISTNFSHYVGKAAREVAATGSWNLHKSYLPHNRGMAPSFFALLNDDAHAGVTLHVLEKGFDTGAIVDQRKVSINQGDTVYDLNLASSTHGGEMLAEVLSGSPLDLVPQPQPDGDWPEHTYPSPAEIKRFAQQGHRFDKWTLGDLKGIKGLEGIKGFLR